MTWSHGITQHNPDICLTLPVITEIECKLTGIPPVESCCFGSTVIPVELKTTDIILPYRTVLVSELRRPWEAFRIRSYRAPML